MRALAMQQVGRAGKLLDDPLEDFLLVLVVEVAIIAEGVLAAWDRELITWVWVMSLSHWVARPQTQVKSSLKTR